MLLKMSVYSCLSGKEAHKRYGVQSLSAKQRKIDDALEKASEIRDTILELANVKEKAVLQTLGYDFTSSDSEDEESNLEEIEGVECISLSEDEAEFPCSIPAGSEVDCVNVEQCGETALGGSQVSVTTSEKRKRSRSEGELNANLGSQVLDPDDTDLLKNATVNPAPSRETLLYML